MCFRENLRIQNTRLACYLRPQNFAIEIWRIKEIHLRENYINGLFLKAILISITTRFIAFKREKIYEARDTNLILFKEPYGEP